MTAISGQRHPSLQAPERPSISASEGEKFIVFYGFLEFIGLMEQVCVVPAAVCKAIHVAAGLALPKDVTLEIVKQ